MPNMANIVVKGADGTSDVTYTQIVASAGDKSPAIWQNLAYGASAALHPEFRVGSRANANRTARVVDVAYSVPEFAVTSNGSVAATSRINHTSSTSIPLGMTDGTKHAFVAEMVNLYAAALTKSVFETGYAPV